MPSGKTTGIGERLSPGRGSGARAREATLHGMSGLVARERAGEVGLDSLLRLAAVLLAELHADSGGALSLVALRALGGHPDHASGDRELLVLAHEVQQHEDLIPQAVIAVGGNEQAAVAHEWHVRQVQG